VPFISFLKEATVFEVVFDDDIRDGVKDKPDVVGVCGAGKMRVDFFSLFPLV
jgi:hypothetical protein